MGFLSSFFSGKKESPETTQQKDTQKNFEILKYDGMRAQRMGRLDYAAKCYAEALKLNEDFETMTYLSQVYVRMGQLAEARQLLERMAAVEPGHMETFLTLANVCFMQEDYPAMARAAQQAIAAEAGNAMAHYLLAKSDQGQGDNLMCVAHLTQAIALKDDFTEARLARAEALLGMSQFQEAADDISFILSQDGSNEAALMLRAQWKAATGDEAGAETDYQRVTELNPFSEQAYLHLGKLFIGQKKLPEAIALFDEAIELNPNFVQAYHERGRAKLLSGDKEGAAEDVKKALELNPKEVEALNGNFDNQSLNRQTDILGL